MAAWFEGFFDGLYKQVLQAQFDEAQTIEQVMTVRRLLKVRKGQRVLDVPCGCGRLTIPLARTGLEMTGADLTKAYLRVAGRRARSEGLGIRWVHSDMRRIEFREAFDGVFNWFGSFGYFSDEDNLAFCKRAFAALKPGGRFLVEGMNKSWLLRHFLPRSEQTIHGVRIEQRNTWHAPTQRVRSTWTFSKGRANERHRIVMRVFNGTEMRALLRSAGFCDVRLFARPPADRFTRHARRLIAVARRPVR